MFYKKELQTEFRSCASITADVNEMVASSGVKEGLCVVSVPHTTAALVITSFWDPRGLADLMDEIDRNIPTRVSYKHQDSPYDASGHVKSAMIGSSATLIIHEGKLVLGSSQGLVFVEFDGPRPREFYVQIVEKPLAIEKVNVGTVYMGMHDLTGEVREVVRRSGVRDGICHVSVPVSYTHLARHPGGLRVADAADGLRARFDPGGIRHHAQGRALFPPRAAAGRHARPGQSLCQPGVLHHEHQQSRDLRIKEGRRHVL